jgi:hypothetical protein
VALLAIAGGLAAYFRGEVPRPAHALPLHLSVCDLCSVPFSSTCGLGGGGLIVLHDNSAAALEHAISSAHISLQQGTLIVSDEFLHHSHHQSTRTDHCPLLISSL